MVFLFLFDPLSWFQECGSGRGEEHSGEMSLAWFESV